MDERYFLYWEEIDWAFRARSRFRLGYARNSIIRHKVGASIGTRQQGPQSTLAEFYMLRGAVLFCSRYSPASLPAILAGAARDLARLARRGDWHGLSHRLRAIAGRHFPADRFAAGKQGAA
jgi:GT2 family glycosyltransferase